VSKSTGVMRVASVLPYILKDGRMRQDVAETLGAVNGWLDLSRGLLAKQVQFPLIDNSDIDMRTELWHARQYGDGSLRAAIDNVLSRDPDDLAARFVALNAYYRLMATEIPQEIQYANGFDQLSQNDIVEHLGYLVRLRDSATCTDAINIRWEIVNASAVKDYPRTLALCDQLSNIVPDGERHYLRGRIHFLIAVIHTWDTDESLEQWDLPLGPGPDGLRRMWQWINTCILTSAGIQKFPTRDTLTDDDLDHLRDATKFLEKAIKSGWDVPTAGRFMLARSYASIGDGANAARHYRWMLDHQDTFFRSWENEVGPLWDGDSSRDTFRGYMETIRAGIHECLINAYDDAGELEKAIGAANSWIDACPDQLGTFERMARLQQKRADPIAAAEYMRKEADRREALGDKAFGEDPNVSIILALGGIVSTSRIDETLKSIATTHHHEHALVESVIRNYWPTFGRLTMDDQQRWVTGSWLLGTNAPQGAGLAVHCFARVVEGELRTSIFARFAEYARCQSEILAGCPDDPFCRYLKGCEKNLALGQMFKILGFARRPASSIISFFAEWLKGDNQWLQAGIGRLRTDRIVDFRNREDHPDTRIVEVHQAEEISKICRDVVDLLHPR
jgi:tetratricopeptide (TPR) repeat protein